MNLSSRELYRLERWSAEVLDLDTLADDEDGRPALLRWLAGHDFVPTAPQSAAIEFQLLTDFGRDDVHTFDSPPSAWHDALEAAAGESVKKFIGQLEASPITERREGFSILDEQTRQYEAVAARLEEIQPTISLKLPARRSNEPPKAIIQRRLLECVMATPVERTLLVMEAQQCDDAVSRQAASEIRSREWDWAALCPPLLDALTKNWRGIAADREAWANCVQAIGRRLKADAKSEVAYRSFNLRGFIRSIVELVSAGCRFLSRDEGGSILVKVGGVFLFAALITISPMWMGYILFFAATVLCVYLGYREYRKQVERVRLLRAWELEILHQAEAISSDVPEPECDELHDLIAKYRSALKTRKYFQMRDTRAALEEFLGWWANVQDVRGWP